MIIVVATRTGSGGVPVRRSDGMIGSGDLNAQKARVLLALALSRTSDPAEVARAVASQQ
jgi:L-asparaginase